MARVRRAGKRNQLQNQEGASERESNHSQRFRWQQVRAGARSTTLTGLPRKGAWLGAEPPMGSALFQPSWVLNTPLTPCCSLTAAWRSGFGWAEAVQLQALLITAVNSAGSQLPSLSSPAVTEASLTDGLHTEFVVTDRRTL